MPGSAMEAMGPSCWAIAMTVVRMRWVRFDCCCDNEATVLYNKCLSIRNTYRTAYYAPKLQLRYGMELTFWETGAL